MSLNPGGTTNYTWNFSNAERDGFSTELTGTVLALQEVQARRWNQATRRYEGGDTYDDGHPKMRIRMALATPEGQLRAFSFKKATKKQVSERTGIHMQLFELSDGNMTNLIGKTIHIVTWPANPETGQPWGLGNPRLFDIAMVAAGPYELAFPLPEEFKVPQLMADDAAHGGQPVATQPQPYQQPYQQQYQQPYQQPYQQQYQQPAMAYSQYVPAATQPQVQQAMQMQPVQSVPPAQVQQAMQPQPLQGMDPAVAAAMQAVGAVNVQQVGSVYDDQIPF